MGPEVQDFLEPSALDAGRLFPAGERLFTGWTGDRSSRSIRSAEQPGVNGGRWSIETAIESRSGGSTAERSQVLVTTPDGSIALAEGLNPRERVEVIFDPPLVIVPNGVERAAARPFVQSLKMRVFPLGDRSRVQSSGPVRNEIRSAADQ